MQSVASQLRSLRIVLRSVRFRALRQQGVAAQLQLPRLVIGTVRFVAVRQQSVVAQLGSFGVEGNDVRSC